MIFFLYGQDSYRAHQKLLKIKEKFKKEIDPSGINTITFSGEDFDLGKFNSASMQAGFLVPKRLVIIKNLLLAKPIKNVAEQLSEMLLRLKKSDNIFVFYEAGEPDKRSALFKTLSTDKKLSQNFEALDNAKLNDWAKNYAQEKNGKINARALLLLTSFVGNNLWLLSGELNKLIAYKNGREILEEDVKTFVNAKITENIFGLTDAVASANQASALKLLEEQLSLGLNEIYLLTMIIRQFRILLQIKPLLDKKMLEKQIAEATGLHPFVIKKSAPLAKKFTLEKLKKIYLHLAQLDKQFKSTALPPKTLLDLLIMKV
ncbi:MAG: DNA polymerase III subunit delta [Patescibacteria group bacterium]|jgi:DNA polymerase-3 subunit delta